MLGRPRRSCNNQGPIGGANGEPKGHERARFWRSHQKRPTGCAWCRAGERQNAPSHSPRNFRGWSNCPEFSRVRRRFDYYNKAHRHATWSLPSGEFQKSPAQRKGVPSEAPVPSPEYLPGHYTSRDWRHSYLIPCNYPQVGSRFGTAFGERNDFGQK